MVVRPRALQKSSLSYFMFGSCLTTQTITTSKSINRPKNSPLYASLQIPKSFLPSKPHIALPFVVFAVALSHPVLSLSLSRSLCVNEAAAASRWPWWGPSSPWWPFRWLVQHHIFLHLLLVLLLAATRLLRWFIWASCRPTSSSCTRWASSSTWPTSTNLSWATWTTHRPTRSSWANHRPTRSSWATLRPTRSSWASRRSTTILRKSVR